MGSTQAMICYCYMFPPAILSDYEVVCVHVLTLASKTVRIPRKICERLIVFMYTRVVKELTDKVTLHI